MMTLEMVMQTRVGTGRLLPMPSYIWENTGMTLTMMTATTQMAMVMTVIG